MMRLLADAERLAHMGSWELDLRSGDLIWSEEMWRIRGLEPGCVRPGVATLVEAAHHDDSERLRAFLERVVETPGSIPPEGLTIEYRIVRPDGLIRDVRSHGRVELDERGRPERWIGFSQDVTSQRLTERELQAHYAVNQALRDWESFEEGVMSLLRRLGTALDYPVGSLWVCDEEQGTLACRAFWRAPSVDVRRFEAATRATSLGRGEGVPGRVWVEERPLVTDDLPSDPHFARRTHPADTPLRSGLAFPALGKDGTLAVLSYYARERRQPSDHLVRTLAGIGGELGRFLAQRRGELGAGRLSARELEVLRLAAEGNSGPDIAERLVVSPATVKTHFEHIYEKLGVGDRASAVAQALRVGLIH